MIIRPATLADIDQWVKLRHELWPEGSIEEHTRETKQMLENRRERVLVCEAGGKLQGFVEARLRDYAEGCETTPVGYIEGWYVAATARRQGIGRALIEAAEHWARERKAARRWLLTRSSKTSRVMPHIADSGSMRSSVSSVIEKLYKNKKGR